MKGCWNGAFALFAKIFLQGEKITDKNRERNGYRRERNTCSFILFVDNLPNLKQNNIKSQCAKCLISSNIDH